MSEKAYKYFVVVDYEYTRDNPFALLRRVVMPDGGFGRDEAFSPAHDWQHTTLLRSAERGNLDKEFIEIDEAEAKRVEEKFLAERAAKESQQ